NDSIWRVRTLCEKQQRLSSRGLIRRDRQVLKMAISPHPLLPRPFGNVAPEKERFRSDLTTPVPVCVDDRRLDPIDFMTNDAVGQIASRVPVARRLADDGEREGHWVTSAVRAAGTHFSPTWLQNSPGVIASFHCWNFGCSSRRAVVTRPASS